MSARASAAAPVSAQGFDAGGIHGGSPSAGVLATRARAIFASITIAPTSSTSCSSIRSWFTRAPYFDRPGASLDQAQSAKLDLICRKLYIQPQHRFLDIGCGWGALVLNAARGYSARASGCTLSRRQIKYASARIRAEYPTSEADFREMDYRDVSGQFDKISSVGMFEHVGRAQLEVYFRKVHDLLAPHGIFLNHGITRPAPIHSDAQSLFIARSLPRGTARASA